MKMRNFGIIYIIAVLVVAGIYYFSLPDQEIYLKEKRWSNDESSIVLDVEEQMTVIYTKKAEKTRTLIPGKADVPANTDVTPIDKKERFIEHIKDFKESTDNLEVKNYLDSLIEDFEEIETRYTGAFTETSLLLRVQEIQPPLAAGMEPVIIDEYEVTKKVYMVYIYKNGKWEPAAMAEKEGSSWVMTEKMIERYILE